MVDQGNPKAASNTDDQLRLLAPLTSGKEGAAVWDRVWSGDPYADPAVRTRRSRRRLTSFGLLEGSLPIGARLLDIGCGAGDSLAVLSQAFGEGIDLTGADFSTRAVARARARLGDRAHVVEANVTSLPFRDAHFSHVLVFGLIEHVRDDVRALAEIHRVSAPGARIFVSTSNASSTLQGINFLRRNTFGYPYGYQRNWRRVAVVSELERYFRIENVAFEHADGDMPLIRITDRFLGRLLPDWGRYIHIVCEKRQ